MALNQKVLEFQSETFWYVDYNNLMVKSTTPAYFTVSGQNIKVAFIKGGEDPISKIEVLELSECFSRQTDAESVLTAYINSQVETLNLALQNLPEGESSI